jgi:hypothetical protein
LIVGFTAIIEIVKIVKIKGPAKLARPFYLISNHED